MKRLIFLLLSCLPICLVAQETNNIILSESQFNGISFDEINVRELVKRDNGQVQVYFDIKKRVGVRNAHNEFKPNRLILGVGQVTLNSTLKADEEQYILFTPNFSATKDMKKFTVLNGQKKNASELCTSESMVPYSYAQLNEHFPDYPTILEDENPPIPTFYNNRLMGKSAWGKTDKIRVEKSVLDNTKGKRTKYKISVEEVPLNINSDDKKADFWTPQKHDYTDQVTGYVYSLQGKVINKRVTSAYTNKEWMTFSPTGELINSFDLSSKDEKEPELVKMYTYEENGKTRIDGGLILLKNRKKKKKKKGPPPPNPFTKNIYEFDKDGKLVQAFEFTPENFTSFKHHWKFNNQHRFLSRTGFKFPNLEYYASNQEDISLKHKMTLDSPEFKGHNYAPKWFAMYGVYLQDNYTIEEDNELVVFSISGTTKVPWNQEEKIDVNKGYLLLLLNKEGAVIGSQAIIRDMQKPSDKAIQSDLIFEGFSDGVASWVMIDEAPGRGEKYVFTAKFVKTDLKNQTTTVTELMKDQTEIELFDVDDSLYLIGKTIKKKEEVNTINFEIKAVE